MYASFGYGKLVKYVDTSGYLITSPTGTHTKDSSGNNILVLDSSGDIVFPTINYNITTAVTTVAKNLAGITMSYGWYVDSFGLVHKDNYVNSSGFATYIDPGSLNQLGGSGYSYTPTAADVSISYNMRNYIHSFIKTGVPTFFPNAATSNGMGYVFNSDSSGNDISGVATVDSFNSGAIGFLMQQFYGLTAAQIAANYSLGGNYYLYPYSNL